MAISRSSRTDGSKDRGPLVALPPTPAAGHEKPRPDLENSILRIAGTVSDLETGHEIPKIRDQKA
jgi:hypothetical protein